MPEKERESGGSRLSLRALREAEKALDERASLIDRETDIDYRETFRVIGRTVLLLRYFWLRYAITFVMSMIPYCLSMVLAPFMVKVVIDHVVLGQPVEDVTGYPPFLIPVVGMLEGASAPRIMSWVALLTVVGMGSRLALTYVSTRLHIRLSQAIGYLVRARLFENVQSLPMAKLDDQPIGDSVYRVRSDSNSIIGIIYTVIQQPVIALSAFAVALVTLLSAYPDFPFIALWAVGAMPMYVAATTPFARMLRRRAQAASAAGTAFTSNIEEGMDNMLAVQSLGANETERERFRKDSAESFKRIRFSTLALGLVETLGEASMLLLELFFFVYLAGHVIAGDLSVGDFSVVLTYVVRMRETGHAFVRIWIEIQGKAAQARRVFAMMDQPPETETGDQDLPPIHEGVSFRQVGLVYPDGRRALQDVAFDAHMGQIVAIVGPTGAGKTTLAHLIPRYHVASEGQVLIDGHDVNDVTIESLRGQVSYVFQETQTVAESVFENIRLGKPDATPEEVERAARTAGIHDFIVSLPDGYDTMLGTTSSKLSVGQKQRIGIARGLLKDSRILILDEPTSALDPETEEHLVNSLYEAAKDRIVFIIAHRLSTVAIADQIVFLDEGHVLEQGTHAELMARGDGNYRRFVELQSTSFD
ncbi:MAG: ABC transporter ATP-binding protein [Dehalococcoidia bacterium]|jgi:ABC-type multidrug transport system fused ATPase/permease subunit|nr:ABC transporter ATP-binding protein [Dehalococcoidia bacterium]